MPKTTREKTFILSSFKAKSGSSNRERSWYSNVELNNNITTRIYLAGMLDFEGNFEVTYDPLPRPRIALAQKSRQLLDAIQKLYGGKAYRMQLVIFKTSEVERFLADVQAYVVMRREEALLALALSRVILLNGGHGKRVPTQELKDLRSTLATQLHEAYLRHKASKTLEVIH